MKGKHDREDIFSNHYWCINRFMLKIVGLWPYQSACVKIGIRVFLVLFIHSMAIPMLVKIIYEWRTGNELVLENVSGIFYLELVIVKYVHSWFTEVKLRHIYERISSDWRDWDDLEERKILAKHAQRGRTLTINFTAFFSTISVTFTLLPALIPMFLDLVNPLDAARQKTFCYYLEYFIDQQVYYYELLFHTFLCIMCIMLLYTTIDSAYVCCVQHIVGLLQVVEHRLEKALDLTRKKQTRRRCDLDSKIHDCVTSAIKLHQKSIDFIDLLQTTYSTCLFVTTLMFLLAVSLITANLNLYSNDPVILFRLLSALSGSLFYLFYISFPGQKIIDSSSHIFNSAYFCGWYKFPLKTQHLLRFLMLRSAKSCVFSAGPFYKMNLEHCGYVLKIIISYCTFVKSMVKK